MRDEFPAKPKRLVDEPYLAWVRTLPCRVRESDLDHRCQGDVQAHHRVGGGMGTKTGDRQTFPLCAGHHRARHDMNGPFKGWDRERMREWERNEVLATLGRRLGLDGVF